MCQSICTLLLRAGTLRLAWRSVQSLQRRHPRAADFAAQEVEVEHVVTQVQEDGEHSNSNCVDNISGGGSNSSSDVALSCAVEQQGQGQDEAFECISIPAETTTVDVDPNDNSNRESDDSININAHVNAASQDQSKEPLPVDSIVITTTTTPLPLAEEEVEVLQLWCILASHTVYTCYYFNAEQVVSVVVPLYFYFKMILLVILFLPGTRIPNFIFGTVVVPAIDLMHALLAQTKSKSQAIDFDVAALLVSLQLMPLVVVDAMLLPGAFSVDLVLPSNVGEQEQACCHSDDNRQSRHDEPTPATGNATTETEYSHCIRDNNNSILQTPAGVVNVNVNVNHLDNSNSIIMVPQEQEGYDAPHSTITGTMGDQHQHPLDVDHVHVPNNRDTYRYSTPELISNKKELEDGHGPPAAPMKSKREPPAHLRRRRRFVRGGSPTSPGSSNSNMPPSTPMGPHPLSPHSDLASPLAQSRVHASGMRLRRFSREHEHYHDLDGERERPLPLACNEYEADGGLMAASTLTLTPSGTATTTSPYSDTASQSTCSLSPLNPMQLSMGDYVSSFDHGDDGNHKDGSSPQQSSENHRMIQERIDEEGEGEDDNSQGEGLSRHDHDDSDSYSDNSHSLGITSTDFEQGQGDCWEEGDDHGHSQASPSRHSSAPSASASGGAGAGGSIISSTRSSSSSSIEEEDESVSLSLHDAPSASVAASNSVDVASTSRSRVSNVMRALITGDSHIRVRDYLFDLDLAVPAVPSSCTATAACAMAACASATPGTTTTKTTRQQQATATPDETGIGVSSVITSTMGNHSPTIAAPTASAGNDTDQQSCNDNATSSVHSTGSGSVSSREIGSGDERSLESSSETNENESSRTRSSCSDSNSDQSSSGSDKEPEPNDMGENIHNITKRLDKHKEDLRPPSVTVRRSARVQGRSP
jgi:hypothetical protein